MKQRNKKLKNILEDNSSAHVLHNKRGMEAVEIVIYILIAFVIGGMVILFVAGINPTKIYDAIHSLVSEDKDLSFEQIGSEDIANRAYQVWEQCRFGAQEVSATYSVSKTKEEDTLSKAFLFTTYRKLNLCSSIQSAEQGCGSREDVRVTPKEFPAIVSINCDVQTRQLVIA